jgi:ATP-dependent exoDNAse (exonuclease V) alpha subunit
LGPQQPCNHGGVRDEIRSPCSPSPLPRPAQVLCATKKTFAGVAHLNKLLQPLMNPLAGRAGAGGGRGALPGLPRAGFALGDRVIQVSDAPPLTSPL